MKAVVYRDYGPPEVLRLEDLDKPRPEAAEVCIRIYATTVTATDCTFRKGEPLFVRLFTGLKRPRNQVLGTEFAGEIASVGEDVQTFKIGDRIFGTVPGFGAYAEYLCLPEANATLATMPANLTFEEAVACCDGFLTALPFLRDTGHIQRGHSVLVNGASGSVGSAAVQLARHFGATVTGVCSTANVDLVKSLGADRVIDYTREDFTKGDETYDIIFDTVGKTTFSRCQAALKPSGVFLEAGITLAVLPQVLLTKLVGSKKAKIAATGLRPPQERTQDLVFLRGLMEDGTITPVIDRSYPLDLIADAHRYVDQGHKKGNVVVTLA